MPEIRNDLYINTNIKLICYYFTNLFHQQLFKIVWADIFHLLTRIETLHPRTKQIKTKLFNPPSPPP